MRGRVNGNYPVFLWVSLSFINWIHKLENKFVGFCLAL